MSAGIHVTMLAGPLIADEQNVAALELVTARILSLLDRAEQKG